MIYLLVMDPKLHDVLLRNLAYLLYGNASDQALQPLLLNAPATATVSALAAYGKARDAVNGVCGEDIWRLRIAMPSVVHLRADVSVSFDCAYSEMEIMLRSLTLNPDSDKVVMLCDYGVSSASAVAMHLLLSQQGIDHRVIVNFARCRESDLLNRRFLRRSCRRCGVVECVADIRRPHASAIMLASAVAQAIVSSDHCEGMRRLEMPPHSYYLVFSELAVQLPHRAFMALRSLEALVSDENVPLLRAFLNNMVRQTSLPVRDELSAIRLYLRNFLQYANGMRNEIRLFHSLTERVDLSPHVRKLNALPAAPSTLLQTRREKLLISHLVKSAGFPDSAEVGYVEAPDDVPADPSHGSDGVCVSPLIGEYRMEQAFRKPESAMSQQLISRCLDFWEMFFTVSPDAVNQVFSIMPRHTGEWMESMPEFVADPVALDIVCRADGQTVAHTAPTCGFVVDGEGLNAATPGGRRFFDQVRLLPVRSDSFREFLYRYVVVRRFAPWFMDYVRRNTPPTIMAACEADPNFFSRYPRFKQNIPIIKL